MLLDIDCTTGSVDRFHHLEGRDMHGGMKILYFLSRPPNALGSLHRLLRAKVAFRNPKSSSKDKCHKDDPYSAARSGVNH